MSGRLTNAPYDALEEEEDGAEVTGNYTNVKRDERDQYKYCEYSTHSSREFEHAESSYE